MTFAGQSNLMTKAIGINFIAFQDILPINENGVNCNWGVKQMKMVFSVGHLWVPWPQVVVTQG